MFIVKLANGRFKSGIVMTDTPAEAERFGTPEAAAAALAKFAETYPERTYVVGAQVVPL